MNRRSAGPVEWEPTRAAPPQTASRWWRKRIVLDSDIIQQLPINLRSLIEKAQSASRGSLQFSYRFTDAAGEEQIYRSFDEMPADVREHFERLQGLRAKPGDSIPGGLHIQLDLKGLPLRKVLLLAASLGVVMVLMLFATILL